MPLDPILHLLGLARKAGRLEIGEEPVGAACRARRARLLLLAADASPNTCRRCAHFGQTGNVLWLPLPVTKAELGFSLGRGACAMLAVTDFGFAASVADKLAARDPERYGPAAQQLREKADRALQRQREQRQHEKNLREGKRKPWVPPPARQEKSPAPPPGGGKTGNPPRPARAGSGGRFSAKDGVPRKPGPGGRTLTGKRPGTIPKK